MDLNTLQEVIIDPSGGYKFIIVNVTDSNGGTKMIMRANQEYGNHKDIFFDMLKREVKPSGLDARCIGGGRIRVDPEEKIILI